MAWKPWVAFFAGLAALLTYLLLRWPDPAGPNGYFYLKNIQELSAFRGFYFRDYSLSLLFPAAINLVVRNPHVSWAVAVGTTAAATPCLLWALVTGLTRKSAGLLPAFLSLAIACQYPLLELELVYFKNAFALALALASLACAAWSIGREDGRKLRGGALLFAILALFSHKSMILWLFVLGLTLLSPRLLAARDRLPRAVVPGLAALAAAATLSYGRLWPQVIDALSLSASPDAFRFWLRHNFELEPAFTVATVSSFAALVYLAGKTWRRPRENALALATWGLVLLLDFHPWQEPGSNGLHYRLWLLLPVLPVALAGELYVRAKPYGRIAMAAALVAAFAWELADMRENFAGDFPEYAALAADVRNIPRFVRPENRLLCRHGLEFYVDYLTGLRCRSFVDHEPKPGTWRIVYTGELPKRAIADLRPLSPLPIGPSYMLLPETAWIAAVAKFHLRQTIGNPSVERPAYIQDQE